MNLREVKFLAAGIIAVSLITTNVIIPAVLNEPPSERLTAITKPTPIEPDAIPEPVRVLSPAEATARAAAMHAHAYQMLTATGELPGQVTSDAPVEGKATCVAGCN